MAHRSFGCPHQTLPLRAIQPTAGKLAGRQLLLPASLYSSRHRSNSEKTVSSHRQCRDRQCSQQKTLSSTHFRQPTACHAQSQSGALNSDYNGPHQVPQHTAHAQVPWGMKEFVSVTLLWFFGFWCLGYFVLPGTLSLFGLDKDDLSITKQALYHVVFDVCQLGLTVRILCQQLKAFRPRQKGWFKTQFRPLQAWLVPVCFAAIFFPILDWVARISVTWFPDDLWTQNIEQSIMRGDSTCNVLYFAVLIFCAPIWEEAIFRGFMLPTLNKYMPRAVSLLLTSAVFAILHFSVQRFVPLVLLGMILGFIYMSTRNLVAPIALHSLWNMYIFYHLLMRGSGILG